MNKNEFINMCISDAGNDETLLYIVELFKEVIPDTFEVDGKKDPKDFYKFMEDYASKNQKNGRYCINPEQSMKLAKEYLGIKDLNILKKNSDILNLEDFF